MGSQGNRRVKKSEEGNSSARVFTQIRKCGPFPRVFSAGLKRFGERSLRHCTYQTNRSFREDMRGLLLKKWRGCNAVLLDGGDVRSA